MLVVTLIIIVGLMIFFEYKNKTNCYSDWYLTRIFTIPILITNLIAILVLGILLTDCRIIDQKIELYQNQNREVEDKIEITVKQYMNFEADTYKEFKTDSFMNLVNLYPELKSDELIQQQIKLYTKNNESITQLKKEKVNKTIYRWWIYFGK